MSGRWSVVDKQGVLGIVRGTAVSVSLAWTSSTITANSWLATPTRVVDKGEISLWLNAKTQAADAALVQKEVPVLSTLHVPTPPQEAHTRSCCLFWISLNLQWFRNHSKWWSTPSPSSAVQVVLLKNKYTEDEWQAIRRKERGLSFSISTYWEKLSSDMKPISLGNSATHTSSHTYTH